jgi:CRP-like cAMP-binding protein
MPHLTLLLWLNTLPDAAIHREWLVSAGRRNANQHLAHLFCERAVRHDLVGLGHDGRCPFPFTQVQLTIFCGLTDVHVNRVLQELRALGLIEVVRPSLSSTTSHAERRQQTSTAPTCTSNTDGGRTNQSSCGAGRLNA